MSPKKTVSPTEAIEKLNNVIASGEPKNVHLLCGAEHYLRLEYKKKLLEALGATQGSMNFDRFVGKDTVPEKVIDLAETLPFFADRRVILLEDTGWFRSGCDAMADYISQGICETTCLIFCEQHTARNTRMFKAVEKAGMVSQFETQDPAMLRAWIARELKKAGIGITGAESEYLIETVGSDMTGLATECEKLIGYCMDRGRVTKNDIDAICCSREENKVYEMCNAIALNNPREALGAYFNLMGQKEMSARRLASSLCYHYDNLIKIKDLQLRGYRNDEQIAAIINGKERPVWIDRLHMDERKSAVPENGTKDKLRESDVQTGEDGQQEAAEEAPAPKGCTGWQVKRLKNQAGKYTFAQLEKLFGLCQETDMNIKSGRIEEQVAVEQMIVRLSGVRA